MSAVRPWLFCGSWLPAPRPRGCYWRCRLCGDNTYSLDPAAAIRDHLRAHDEQPLDWFHDTTGDTR